MGIEENKEIVLNHLSIFNEGNLELADDIISPDYIYHMPDGGTLNGPEGFKQLVSMTRDALPDVHLEFDSIVDEGDWVVALYTMTATHTGNFMGVPATGRKLELQEACCCRFENNQEVEAIPYNDLLSFYLQIGTYPPVE